MTQRRNARSILKRAPQRIGSRDVEEQSIALWIQNDATKLAVLWPNVPSWSDWRQHVSPGHVAVIDEAWHSVTDAGLTTAQDREGGQQ